MKCGSRTPIPAPVPMTLPSVDDLDEPSLPIPAAPTSDSSYRQALDLTLDPVSIGLTVTAAFLGYKAQSSDGYPRLGYILTGGLLGLYMLNLSQAQSH